MAHSEVEDEVRMKPGCSASECSPLLPLELPPPKDAEQVTVLRNGDSVGGQGRSHSTSRTMVLHGVHLLLFASRLQKTVALSSGEVELKSAWPGHDRGALW